MRRKLAILIISIFIFVGLKSQQDTIFFDNFENGLNNWVVTGQWGLTTMQSHSPSHSLSESPNGNYGNNWNTYCTMANGLNLVHYPSATLSFWSTYKIETGFDYMYVEASTDDFQTFETLKTFNGEDAQLPPFQQVIIDLGAFCGKANVKIRFHFFSDQGYITDGMYIDDFLITYSLQDLSAPLISHLPAPFLEGSLGNQNLIATISDYSGVNQTSVKVYYSVDNGSFQYAIGTFLNNNQYSFTIPAQNPGSYIRYYFYAEDVMSPPNVAVSDTFAYVAGNHIIQDNGQVDYFLKINAGQGAAVKVNLNNTNLVSMLIRNYVDINNPNDSMLIHVWNDNNGLPGSDVITPFKVFPAATLTNTSHMTWIDLRSYSSQLSNLNGTYYIGFTVPSGVVNITVTQPGNSNASFFYDGSAWAISTGSNGVNDHHFRAVTSAADDVSGPIIINNSVPIHYEASSLPQTINATITDISGVADAKLYYKVDNGTTQVVQGINSGGNLWTFNISAVSAGSWVKYWIEATDMATPNPFTSQTDTFIYVSGVYHKYDNNTPNVYIPVGSMYNTLQAIGLLLDLGNNPVQLTTLLIRNYYSVNNPSNTPNDPMRIHVWDMNYNDIIPPFIVNSEAGPNSPMAMTRIDLRPYANQLSNLTGTVIVGYTVDNGMCAVLGDTNAIYNKTVAYDGTSWGLYYADAQIRAVTSEYTSNIKPIDNEFGINVYPNPVNNIVNIYLNNFENTEIEIYSAQGILLKKCNVNSNNTQIELSSFSKGVYFVKATNAINCKIVKLIKE